MYFIVLILSFFCSLQVCLSQGNFGNNTNNSNSNSSPTLFEINTITNSNSQIPTAQDSAHITIDLNNEIIENEKKQESKKEKVKLQKSQPTVSKDKIISEKSAEKTTLMNSLNQNFSIVYDETRTQRNQRNPTVIQQEYLNKTLQTVKSIDSTSFDYYLMKVKAGNYDVNNHYYLVKANDLNSSHPDVQKQFLAFYIINGDTSSTEIMLKNQVTNKEISTEFINYGIDLLNSTPQNSTLITHSFDDTYSVLLHQLNNQMRQDVTIINLDFCQSKKYRDLLVDKGYKLDYNGTIDTRFLADFVSLNSTKNIALSMTLPKDYFLNQSVELGICGLVFIPTYESNIDDYNQRLWENQLTKKVLFVDTDKGKQLSKNYLPLLLELSQLYEAKKQFDKKREIDDWITKIGKKTNVSDQLKKLKD
jgi:hypothetical protein